MGIPILIEVMHLEGAYLSPRNGGEIQRPKKNCAKCGRSHSGECSQGTNGSFFCGKSGHMVKDFPQNRGLA